MTATCAAEHRPYAERVGPSQTIPVCIVDEEDWPCSYLTRHADTDVLQQIDATVEGRCAGPGCSMPLTADSPSAWWCSPECQAAYHRQGTDRPEEVRGSSGVGADEARWRPDLVAVFDYSDLTPLSSQQVGPEGPTRCVYLHRDGRMFLRLDDGHRFVGTFMEQDEFTRASGLGELGAAWRRLERELTDPRRLDTRPDRTASQRLDVLLTEVPAEPHLHVGGNAVTVDASHQEQSRPRGYRRVLAAAVWPWLWSVVRRRRCSGHRRWTCFPCDWRRGRPEEHRWQLRGWIRRRSTRHPLRISLRVDTSQFEQAMGDVGDAFRQLGEQVGVAALPAGEALRGAVTAGVQAESDRVALRAVCNDEAMFERAMAAAEERGMSARQMLEAVVTGRYIGSGWSEWSCSIDRDPNSPFPAPEYTRLPHGAYQYWCSLPDETKVELLRAAREVATVSRSSQEEALARVLAACETARTQR